MRRTALAALCLAAAATAGLSGCLPGADKAESKPKGPFAGQTGGEIADRAIKVSTGASSLRLKGDVSDDESSGTIRLDLALNKKGECAGTMSMNGQGKAELIKIGSTVYLKFDETFLRAQSKGEPKSDTDAAVDMLAGKWTKMGVKGEDAKDFTAFCDLNSLLDDATDGHSNATRGKTTTLDGVPAIALHEKDGKENYTLLVATQGKPYLLKIDGGPAKDPVHLSFSDFNRPVPAKKPAGKIIDLDALGG
ncbi:hypothetical protein [Streptomyces sp. NPDC086787]|uniref:hypothetical protein n=1 Tax=Streptomyces sp. NPDC086787 TaxID=3365759 RepID=UPI00382CD5F9